MRNRFEEWCETTDITVDEIERRASTSVENGGFPTMVFISGDLLAELHKSLGSRMRYSGNSQPISNIMSISTSAGHLNIQHVMRLRNFILVGRKEDMDALTAKGVDPIFWNDEEKLRIDKAFEETILETDE